MSENLHRVSKLLNPVCRPVFGARKATLPVHVNTYNTQDVLPNQDSFQRSAWMQPEGETPLSFQTRSVLYPKHPQAQHTEPLLVRRSGSAQMPRCAIVDLAGRLRLSFQLETEKPSQPAILIKELKGTDTSDAELDELFRYIYAEQQATLPHSSLPWTLTLLTQLNLHVLTAQLKRLGWQPTSEENVYTLSSRTKARYTHLHHNEPIQLNQQDRSPYRPSLNPSSPRPQRISIPKGKQPPTVLIGDFFNLKSPSLSLGQEALAPKTTHGHLVDAILTA